MSDTFYQGYFVWGVNVVSGCMLLSVFGFFGIVQKNVYGEGVVPFEESLDDSSLSAMGDAGYSPREGRVFPKYGSSNLSDSHVKELFKDLLDYMEQEKPYLNSNLMIQELADSLQLPARELSRVINQTSGKSFLDFVNGYRLSEAKRVLIEKSSMNVLEVAMSCGFNSKSSFYQVFKKAINLTPSQYRKKERVENTGAE